ncbi:hypothetical protein [Bacillus cereus]|uniref:hypothetical protein n=1 Tax=Bacillus cereus TaxID=1396 RepID=UPI002AC1C0EB|nr:hypothetical protein [Bacillus cereus]MDZ4567229.1 hypothetical protein [Bacillus cereus]
MTMRENELDVMVQETQSEDLLLEHIEHINKMLKTETQKKLNFIEFYLLQHLQLDVCIQTKEDLENFIKSENASEEIVMDIFDLLDQSFSRGYPQYIFEFSLIQGVSQQKFFEMVNTALPKGTIISSPNHKEVEITRIGDIDFTEGETLNFKIQYEKYKANHRKKAQQTKIPEIRSTFSVTFDFSTNLCYIHCGDRNIANSVERLLTRNILAFSKFSAFSVKERLTSTQFNNEYSLSKQTVLALDYLEEEVNHNNHDISDYFGISFANSRSDKVKAVRLRGSNLLESYEVADRIRSGDQIKAVRFQLRKKLSNDNYILSTVTVDFNCPLKITFTNLDNTNYMIDIIHHLKQALVNSLNKVYNEEQIKERLKDIMEKTRIKDSIVIHSLLSQMKAQFEQLDSPTEEKDKFINILDSYRLGG